MNLLETYHMNIEYEKNIYELSKILFILLDEISELENVFEDLNQSAINKFSLDSRFENITENTNPQIIESILLNEFQIIEDYKKTLESQILEILDSKLLQDDLIHELEIYINPKLLKNKTYANIIFTALTTDKTITETYATVLKPLLSK